MKRKILHIVPIDDDLVHEYNVCCSCEPNLTVSATKQIAVHNAIDQREEKEILGLHTEKGWLTVVLKFS